MSDGKSSSVQLTARQRQWLEHLKTWQEQEELSLKDYAVAHGLSVSGFYTAKRWFKRRGIWQGREVGGAQRRARPKLLPVRVTPPALAPAGSAMVRVHLANGLMLEVPEHTEPTRCQALATALGAART